MDILQPDYEKMERKILRQGWSVDEFCEQCAINPKTWSRWKVKTSMPTTRNLINVYGVLAALPKKKASEAA